MTPSRLAAPHDAIHDLVYDVIVVGAGPAGSATAALMAASGARVLVLDRACFPRDKPCAEYVSPGAVRILERLGALERLTPDVGRRLRGMELRAPDGGRYLVEYVADGVRHWGMAVARAELDVALLELAHDRGAEVRQRCRATALLRAEDGTVCGVRAVDAAAGESELRAGLVVGADGLHSVVVRELGLKAPVRWPRRLGLVAHFADVPWRHDYGEMRVGRHGYAGVAPLDARGLVSVGVATRLPAGPVGPPLAALRAVVAEHPDLERRLERGRLVRPVQGVGPLAHAVRASAGPGYLLVGDAAGFVDPFTGEGIFRALRGAELAADAACRALAGADADPGGTYRRCRQAVFGAKQRLTTLVQLFVAVPALMNYAIAHLRRRPHLGAQLSRALGDLEPAGPTLQAAYLWALLSP